MFGGVFLQVAAIISNHEALSIFNLPDQSGQTHITEGFVVTVNFAVRGHIDQVTGIGTLPERVDFLIEGLGIAKVMLKGDPVG